MNAEYSVYNDRKSQTGGTIYFGHGTVNVQSGKKIEVKEFNESQASRVQ